MDRRAFLVSSLMMPVVARVISAAEGWRTFEITTRVELRALPGAARVWIPLPAAATSFQRESRDTWSGTAVRRLLIDSRVRMLVADWPAAARERPLEVVSVVSTRDRSVDLTAARSTAAETPDSRYLQPTTLIPIDGLVRETASAITRGKTTDLARARAIYDWMVDNTLRDPTVRGCGVGDIRWMLETRTFAGKCADLNALFVGLARASGLPARDVYGLRVAPGAEFPSLGKSGNVTTGQHCRADVFVRELGWLPLDPADVAKVRLEERANGPLDDAYLRRARERLFGRWEMNWIAYNDAHDVMLPGSPNKPLPFFMYPQAEIDGERLDPLDADRFKYTIDAREVSQ